MKKVRIAILAIFVCFFMAVACSCSSSSANDLPVNEEDSVGDVSNNDSVQDEPNQDEQTENESNKNEAESRINVENQVLLDQEGIIITLKSLGNDSIFGPSLKVLIENKSDRNVTIQVRDVSINNVMMNSTLFSCDVVAGKSANDDIVFMQSEFDVAGISMIKDIELKFHVFDPETYDSLFDSEVISITTSVDRSFEQPYDNSGFLALDQNNMKVVIKKLNSEESFWGADVYVYIDNNSETDVTIQVRDVSVNGFMMEPMFSCDVLAGKKAYSSITFMENDFVQNDITSIDNMELSFHIFNPASYDTIFDSDVVLVKFGE